MNPLFVAAGDVQELCLEHGWPFCFIGGLAVLRWGEPRLTRDVDVTIVTGFGGEEPVISSLLDRYSSRVDRPAEFARENRVLLLRDGTGVPIDVALGALPFEERAAQRASAHAFEHGFELRTCSAEDLVVMKVFAGRDGDWADVVGIVARQGDALDPEVIWSEIRPLLRVKGDSHAAERLGRLVPDPRR